MMIVFSIGESDIKDFMNKLLRTEMFDNFEARSVSVQSFTTFTIDGMLTNNASGSDETDKKRYFATWPELRPYVINFIRGNVKPRYIKIIFSASSELLSAVHKNASALFLNINYTQDTLTFTTGSSQTEFSLDKGVDLSWDEYIRSFFRSAGITTLEDLDEKE